MGIGALPLVCPCLRAGSVWPVSMFHRATQRSVVTRINMLSKILVAGILPGIEKVFDVDGPIAIAGDLNVVNQLTIRITRSSEHGGTTFIWSSVVPGSEMRFVL
jgi:hypothetical protein